MLSVRPGLEIAAEKGEGTSNPYFAYIIPRFVSFSFLFPCLKVF
jgi:hypothetical protein